MKSISSNRVRQAGASSSRAAGVIVTLALLILGSLFAARTPVVRQTAIKDQAIAAPLLPTTSTPAVPFTFSNTGNLNTARYYQTATLLPNGKVLVAGGVDSSGNTSVSAELYDPASGSWTAGNLNIARYEHT